MFLENIISYFVKEILHISFILPGRLLQPPY